MINSPNIVYILADDMGYGDVGCYNPLSKIPTPNMDLLANQGMCFTNAHSPSAVCTPTRYGLMTGRYCWRSNLKEGVLYNYPMRGDEIPVAPGYPAPPEIASQITTQYIIANLVARITSKGQSIKKGIRWAENELEGVMRG